MARDSENGDRNDPRTISSDEVLALLASLAHIEVDPGELLWRAQVPHSLRDFQERRVHTVSPDIYAAIYDRVILAIETAARRATGISPLRLREFDLLWYCAIACETLAEVIERVSQFADMVEGKLGRHTLSIQSDMAHFSFDSMRRTQTGPTVISDVIGAINLYRMFSWLVGRSLPIDAIDIAYGPGDYQDVTARLSEIPLRFGQDRTGFSFPAAYLQLSNIRTAADLRLVLPITLMSPIRNPGMSAVTARIRRLIDEAVIRQQPIPNLVEMAPTLATSESVIRRKLESEGTSIRQIKQERRLHWAKELLRQPALPIAEIAMRIGFSDETAFRRAFRNWTGQAPSAFRD
jgi:AraC-like DNA-binding protein